MDFAGENDSNIIIYRKIRSFKMQRDIPAFLEKHEKVSLLHSPSLFIMCMKYITLHYQLLDTLECFPDMIGHQLFDYMQKERLFVFDAFPKKQPSASDISKFRLLAIFNEAYAEVFFSSLSIIQMKINFGLYDILGCFSNITELDISYQTVDSAVIGVISKYNRLKSLVMQCIGLDDWKLRELTLPYRMYGERAETLCLLDIAGNTKVTTDSLKILTVFKNLTHLDVSATSIKKESPLIKQYWNIAKLSPYTKIVTKGWAEKVIDDIFSNHIEVPCSKSGKASKFYSSTKARKLMEELPQSHSIDEQLILVPKIQIRAKCTTSKQVHAKQSSTQPTKRKRFDDEDGNNEDNLYQQYFTTPVTNQAKKPTKFSDIYR